MHESNQGDRILFYEISKEGRYSEGRYSIMISMEGNQNILVGLLIHSRKHKAIKYSENISKGLLKKAVETFLFVTVRAHTKEICWRIYSHVKVAAACML